MATFICLHDNITIIRKVIRLRTRMTCKRYATFCERRYYSSKTWIPRSEKLVSITHDIAQHFTSVYTAKRQFLSKQQVCVVGVSSTTVFVRFISGWLFFVFEILLKETRFAEWDLENIAKIDCQKSMVEDRTIDRSKRVIIFTPLYFEEDK